jgi:integrase
MIKATIWIKTRFQGVRYRESKNRRIKVKGHYRPDRCFYIYYKVAGRSLNEKVGWESEGVNAKQSRDIRGDILVNIRTANGFQSLKEKRLIEEDRRDSKAQEKLRKKKENVLFSVLAEKYIDLLKRDRKSWKPDASRYRNHISPKLADTPIKDIDCRVITGLRADLQKKELSPKSVFLVLTLIRAMFNKAPLWGIYAIENPVSEASRLDDKFLEVPDNNRTRYLTNEEAKALLENLSTKSADVHDMTFLSLYTGMRAGEIFKLQWRDIDFKSSLIRIRNPKNDETRSAFITPTIKKILQKRSIGETLDYIFTSKDGNRVSEVSNTFERAVAELGFNDGVEDPLDKVVFHSLRHTFGSWLAQNGEPLQVISDLLGHKDLKMTRRYAKLSPDQKRDAVLRLAKGSL